MLLTPCVAASYRHIGAYSQLADAPSQFQKVAPSAAREEDTQGAIGSQVLSFGNFSQQSPNRDRNFGIAGHMCHFGCSAYGVGVNDSALDLL